MAPLDGGSAAFLSSLSLCSQALRQSGEETP